MFDGIIQQGKNAWGNAANVWGNVKGTVTNFAFENDLVHQKNVGNIKALAVFGMSISGLLTLKSLSIITATAGGLPIVSAIIFFVSLNTAMVFKNLYELAPGYRGYFNTEGEISNPSGLKVELLKNTFCFKPVVDFLIDFSSKA